MFGVRPPIQRILDAQKMVSVEYFLSGMRLISIIPEVGPLVDCI